MEDRVKLPERFAKNMQILLGEEYESYCESLSQIPSSGLRINSLKISVEEWERVSPFTLREIPWTRKGYYNDRDACEGGQKSFSKHPYYYAGLYYLQEPSAMLPAEVLPVEKGDAVLDLCAAPGGKATELAAKLGGTGLLVANDVSVSRTMALAKNLQLAGVENALVTAETPEHLQKVFPKYFDKILVDAPCSGEGMFRREPDMIQEWEKKGPDYYQTVQKQILPCAYEMLKPGGYMVYSTCTFSVAENEEVVQWLLQKYPDMHLCPVRHTEGFAAGRPDLVAGGDETICHCVRLYPHKVSGEGHFVALFQKEGESEKEEESFAGADLGQTKALCFGKEKSASADWRQEICSILPVLQDRRQQLQLGKDKIFASAVELPAGHGLRIIQNGLIVGNYKRHVEPSVQIALSLKSEEYPMTVNFAAEDVRVVKYLKGETVAVESEVDGWVLVCVDGYSLGWAKGNGKGMLKNKYYAGWRMQ